MGISGQIGAFVAELDPESLPVAVLQAAKTAILDHLGCTLGGYQTSLGQRFLRTLEPAAGTGPARVVGDGRAVSPRDAALINGHFANCLDFDDTYLDLGHPGGPIISAAMAVAEAERASGAMLLAGVVAGYEIAMRLALATRPSGERFSSVYPVPWHSLGAAAACARVLGLDARQVRSALSVAMELAPSSLVRTPEVNYAFKAGKMGHYASAGVEAAMLARAGFDGKQFLLDRMTPFWVAWGTDRCDYDQLTAGLGSQWLLLDLSFKPYPACRLSHPAIDAAREIWQAYKVAPERIRKVEVQTFAWAARQDTAAPRRFEQVPFCLPYVTALGLLGVPPGPEWFSPERMQDPDVLAIAQRTQLRLDPVLERAAVESGRLGARLVAHLESGETVTVLVDEPRGSPANPLSHEEIAEKFLTLARPVLEERAGIIIGLVHQLETVEDVTPLVDLLEGKPVWLKGENATYVEAG